MIVGHPLESIINGPAHHTLHHMYFVVNYGQYFTWADKVGGSYRHPKTEDDPIHTIISREEAKERYLAEKKALSSSSVEAVPAASVPTIKVSSSAPIESEKMQSRQQSTAESSSAEGSTSGRSTPDLLLSEEDGESTEDDEGVGRAEAVTPFEEISHEAALLRRRSTRTEKA